MVLQDLMPRFTQFYSPTDRPSMLPEKLPRALLLQVLYTVRSERLLIEQLDYNLLFRWFVGLNLDDPIWDVTVITKYRERLLAGNIAQEIFGWLKTVGVLRETRHREQRRVGWMFTFSRRCTTLIRMLNLAPAVG